MKKKTSQMTDSDVIAILSKQRSSSIGVSDTSLEQDRASALDYYYARPFGNEEDGWSQVVTRDVQETIDWIMPSIMRVFTSGDEVARFDPVGAEDEAAAEQETDAINYIVTKRNEWFPFVWDWTKTALLEKNSYCEVWVEDKTEETVERYYGLTDDAMGELLADETIEPLEHSEVETFIPVMSPQGEINQPIVLHDIKIKRIEQKKTIRFEAIPTEEMRIAKSGGKLSVRGFPFVERQVRKTISDLIEEGFDEDLLNDIGQTGGETILGELSIAREEHDFHRADYEEADDTMREVIVYKSWLRFDFDGDGIAELRQVISAGDKVLSNDEIDFIPIATLCPNPMPHRHTGLSVADPVMDIQLIKSNLVRMMLDNLYLTNNPQKEVVTKKVNMDDLLENVCGGLFQVEEIGSIREIHTTFTAGASFPMLELLDSMKASRTGISPGTTNLDPNILSKSTHGAFMAGLEQANQLTELIVRVFAETGFRELMLMVHELMLKNPDIKQTVKLRGKWVDINPLEWKDRTNMSVSIGLGTGNKDQLLARLWAVADKQVEYMAQGMPVVTPHNLYNTLDKIVQKTDLKESELYFTAPEKIPKPQPKADPTIDLMKAQLGIERDRLGLEKDRNNLKINEMQVKMQEQQAKHERELEKLQNDSNKTAGELAARLTELELKYRQNVPGALV